MRKLLKQIMKMDVKSEEWNDLYHAVRERHWETTPDIQDDYYYCAKLLNDLANRDVPDLIIVTAKIATEAFKVMEGLSSALTAEIHTKNHKLYFKVAKDRDSIDNLQKQLANTVMVKAKQ